MRLVTLFEINPKLRIVWNPAPIVPGIPYTTTGRGYGGAGSFTFTESGALPTGITFTDNGNGTFTIAGTTAVIGISFPIVVTVQDANRLAQPYSVTLQVTGRSVT